MNKMSKINKPAHIFGKKWRSDDVRLREEASFSSLLLSRKVLKGLKNAGYEVPSPIQMEAIPVGLFGRDLLVQAKSGTGKTLVFTIVALETLLEVKHPQTLIISPTREIAMQICDVVKAVGSSFKHLSCHCFIGGIKIEYDVEQVAGCQIVVGTPGRLKHLIKLGMLSTQSFRLLVIDEFDVMLEPKFKEDLDFIFNSLPKDKQVIATSATYPEEVKSFILEYFKNPYCARLNFDELSLLGMVHYFYRIELPQMSLLAYKAKLYALEKVLSSIKFVQCLVFCNVISRVEELCMDICTWGFTTKFISRAQDQQDRIKAIKCLKEFKCRILVSSDLTSRGIDAENVDLVINFDKPISPEVYFHRCGRAGRYGTKGVAITFIASNEIQFVETLGHKNFEAYFLPDPIPSNLINIRPQECAPVVNLPEISSHIKNVSSLEENSLENEVDVEEFSNENTAGKYLTSSKKSDITEEYASNLLGAGHNEAVEVISCHEENDKNLNLEFKDNISVEEKYMSLRSSQYTFYMKIYKEYQAKVKEGPMLDAINNILPKLSDLNGFLEKSKADSTRVIKPKNVSKHLLIKNTSASLIDENKNKETGSEKSNDSINKSIKNSAEYEEKVGKYSGTLSSCSSSSMECFYKAEKAISLPLSKSTKTSKENEKEILKNTLSMKQNVSNDYSYLENDGSKKKDNATDEKLQGTKEKLYRSREQSKIQEVVLDQYQYNQDFTYPITYTSNGLATDEKLLGAKRKKYPASERSRIRDVLDQHQYNQNFTCPAIYTSSQPATDEKLQGAKEKIYRARERSKIQPVALDQHQDNTYPTVYTSSGSANGYCARRQHLNAQRASYRHANSQCARSEYANTQCARSQPGNTQCARSQHLNVQRASYRRANSQCARSQLANTQCARSQHANTQCARSQHANTQCACSQHANTQCASCLYNYRSFKDKRCNDQNYLPYASYNIHNDMFNSCCQQNYYSCDSCHRNTCVFDSCEFKNHKACDFQNQTYHCCYYAPRHLHNFSFDWYDEYFKQWKFIQSSIY